MVVDNKIHNIFCLPFKCVQNRLSLFEPISLLYIDRWQFSRDDARVQQMTVSGLKIIIVLLNIEE